MTAPLLFRIKHQFLTEWRHLRGWVLAWIAWVMLQRFWRGYEVIHQASEQMYTTNFFGEDLALIITLLFAATLGWLCARSDPPANTDSSALTRPIGQGALWLGKLVFLACCVALPMLLVEGLSWRGFQHGWAQWLALGGGLLLILGLAFSLTGALTALCSSARQAVTVAVFGLLAAACWLGLVGTVVHRMVSPNWGGGVEAARQCGVVVAAGIAFGALMVAWWTATVPRRRGLAAVLLLAGLAQAPMVAVGWPVDWLTRPSLIYPEGRLTVKTGKAAPDDPAPGQELWPTLWITGLGRDEAATILALAPIQEGAEAWPPPECYTDAPNSEGYMCWLNVGHARVLMSHSPPAVLWREPFYYPGTDASGKERPKIQEVVKELSPEDSAPPKRWRLRLVVHEMRRLDRASFREFAEGKRVVSVRPGNRLEFQPMTRESRDDWNVNACMRHVRSLLLPERAYAPAFGNGRVLDDYFYLALEDEELRENTLWELVPRFGGRYMRGQSFAWQMDRTNDFAFASYLKQPGEQRFLLGTTIEEWTERLHVSLWHPEERGVIDLELSAEEMARALETP